MAIDGVRSAIRHLYLAGKWSNRRTSVQRLVSKDVEMLQHRAAILLLPAKFDLVHQFVSYPRRRKKKSFR